MGDEFAANRNKTKVVAADTETEFSTPRGHCTGASRENHWGTRPPPQSLLPIINITNIHNLRTSYKIRYYILCVDAICWLTLRRTQTDLLDTDNIHILKTMFNYTACIITVLGTVKPVTSGLSKTVSNFMSSLCKIIFIFNTPSGVNRSFRHR